MMALPALHDSAQRGDVAHKLGQLQAQLLHLSAMTQEDDYWRHLDYTYHFASEVSTDLTQLLTMMERELPRKDQANHA